MIRSQCALCDVLVHWKALRQGPSKVDVEPLDADSTFPCEHWREHHEACWQALESETGKAEDWTVQAEVLSRTA